MKHITTLALALFILVPTAQASSLCGEKEQSIQSEINYAEQHNNSHRVEGLKKALSEVKAHCTDSQLIAEHQEKITKQKAEIAERQRDLDKTRLKGDADKIAKREKKLAKAESELKSLEERKY
ncbi:DUF1090 domain-containing protein [Citrobacter sp. JGM124]|uniref:DUF1090 domain-containing protein n=1 Tax=Citrobacter sp. JGM124 TaxID=2799789 RepID=UPI001BAC8B59|nr:DUF1090 domain-containing protein [Citrobacter sp. JGM124]MBS0849200.1 DUF1090 domain-containing protein [Citrobacter sp. JGM124]